MTEPLHLVTAEEWARNWLEYPHAKTAVDDLVQALVKRIADLDFLLGDERSRRRETEANLTRLRADINAAVRRGIQKRAEDARSALDAVRSACEDLQDAFGEDWRY